MRLTVLDLFPNNDTAPLRRKRIHIIIQLGAAWARHWKEGITHVVVDDDNLTYNDLLEYLQVSSLPVSSFRVGHLLILNISKEGEVLVKYEYVADCMSYRMLLNPCQRKYRVTGVIEQIKPQRTEIVIPDSQETTLTTQRQMAS